MTNNSHKQRISITVDSQLLEEVDRMTKNRSAAVEEGLPLWRKQQIEEQLRRIRKQEIVHTNGLVLIWNDYIYQIINFIVKVYYKNTRVIYFIGS